MKKLLLYLLLLSTSLGFSQRGINYSAIIKDNSGTVLTNQNVTLEFSILQGVYQMVVYTETHSATTNDHGYINAVIGQGTPTLGTYSAVSWGSDIHFINTSVNTGSGFVSLGITELKAVPYALYAETSGGSSNGAFTSSAGVTKITTETDDFLLGSNQLNYTGTGIDSKAFYDEGLGAFRVGGVTSNNWDTSNIGLRSFASGLNTRATLANATAFGDNSQATGQTSFVMGTNTQASALNTFAGGNTSIASGSNSFAYGNNNSAIGLFTTSFGERTTAQARGSFVIGRFNEVNGNGNTWVATDPLFVVGNGTSDTNRSNALTVYKDGSLETGGLFTIGDPINGNSYTFPAEDATIAGQVLTSDANGLLTWETLPNNAEILDFDNDSYVNIDDGFDSDKLIVTTNGTTELVVDQSGIIVGSFDKLYNPATLNSKRMFYDKNKSALRGGFNDDTSWDDVNVGLYSFSFGENTRATGQTSAAFGGETEANHRAFAMGWQSKAFGSYSFAGGWQSESLGTESFAYGENAIATGSTSSAFGSNTNANGMNSFVVNTNGIASGQSSFSANSGNIASHPSSATFGVQNRSNGSSSFTVGTYNEVVSNSLFVVGDGISDTNRSNAFQIKDDGKVIVNDLQSTERRNVEVLADGTLTTSSKTKKLFIIGNNLVPSNSNGNFISTFSQPGEVVCNGSFFDGIVPINLPQGATIKSMKFYIKEASAGSSTTIVTRIRIREYFNNGSNLISNTLNTYNATSPNSTGVEQRITTGTLSLFHSPERTYFLEVRLGDGDAFRGVEIEYIEP